MYTDLDDILEDQRRLLGLYGVFHRFVHDFSKTHWDLPGFRFRCVLLYLKAALGIYS